MGNKSYKWMVVYWTKQYGVLWGITTEWTEIIIVISALVEVMLTCWNSANKLEH